MAKDYASFIKISEKKYIEELFYKGEVYCKPIRYFSNVDTKDFRGDKMKVLPILSKSAIIK